MNITELRRYLKEKTGRRWRKLKRWIKEIRREPANALSLMGIAITFIYGALGYQLGLRQIELSNIQANTATKIDSFNTLLSQVKVLLDKQNKLIEISSGQTVILSNVSNGIMSVAQYDTKMDSLQKIKYRNEYEVNMDRIYMLHKNLYHLFNKRFVSFSLSVEDKFKDAKVKVEWLMAAKRHMEYEMNNPVMIRNAKLASAYIKSLNSIDENLFKCEFYLQNNRPMPTDESFENCVKGLKNIADLALEEINKQNSTLHQN